MQRRTFLQLAGAGAASLAAGQTLAQSQTPAPQPEATPRTAAITAYGFDKLYDDKEPYILLPGPHLFIDWRYISAGAVGYKDAEGKGVHYFGKKDPSDVKPYPGNVPYGIRLVGQQASKIGNIIPNDREWEYCIYSYCSMFDLGGKFGMWYEVVPPGDDSHHDLLCYAESTDGVNWTKPELNLVEFRGSKKNNIVIDGGKMPHYKTMHGINVWLDPSAGPEERFKIVFMAFSEDDATFEKIQRERPWAVSRYGRRKHSFIQIGSSPDGFHWKFNDKIVMQHMSDTQTICYYDEFLKRYVGYFRTGALGRRAIGRAETDDLYRWPLPDTCLFADNAHEPSVDLYNNSRVMYPGTKDMHIMFPTIYHRRADSNSLAMASSLDGWSWRWVQTDLPGNEVLTPGPEWWDAECCFGACGLVEIPGDRVVFPYTGYQFAHKFPRFPRAGQVCLAVWPKERLCALQADNEGEFWMNPSLMPGQKLYLNVETKQTGYVRVEIVDTDGRKLEDCDPIVGNHIKAPVTWRGNDALGVPEGKAAVLHFRMRAAKLFSFEVR